MVNTVFLLGRVGVKPELKKTNNDRSYCSLSLATHKVWYSKDKGKQEKTTWHFVTVWGKTAENCCQYLDAGAMVFVEGEIVVDKIEQKGGGKPKYITKVQGNQVKFIKKGKEKSDGHEETYGDDIPF